MELENNLIKSRIFDDTIPVFGIVDSLRLGRKEYEVFNNTWSEFEQTMLERNQKITINLNLKSLDFITVLSKVFSPPLISCLIGIFFGMSNMRSVLFSSNHYITNTYSIYNMAAKAYVPFLFINVGNSFMSAPKFNLNFSLSKFTIIITFVTSYIVSPFIGMAYVEIWKAMYGGIIEDSKVFRFCIFVPWALPAASPNFSLVLNFLNRFYFEEYNYLVSKHTLTLILTQTYIFLVYFLIIN